MSPTRIACGFLKSKCPTEHFNNASADDHGLEYGSAFLEGTASYILASETDLSELICRGDMSGGAFAPAIGGHAKTNSLTDGFEETRGIAWNRWSFKPNFRISATTTWWALWAGL